jgi:hypothetical protein
LRTLRPDWIGVYGQGDGPSTLDALVLSGPALRLFSGGRAGSTVLVVLERGEAIGLLVVLAVMLVATLYVAVRRTPSVGIVFAPIELALAGWVLADMGRPDDPGGQAGPGRSSWRGPRPRGGGGGSGVREPRRPRPSSGAGTASRDP